MSTGVESQKDAQSNGVIQPVDAMVAQARDELPRLEVQAAEERRNWIKILHFANTAFLALSAPLAIKDTFGIAKLLMCVSTFFSAVALLLGARALYVPVDQIKRAAEMWKKVQSGESKEEPIMPPRKKFELFSERYFPWFVFASAIMLVLASFASIDYSIFCKDSRHAATDAISTTIQEPRSDDNNVWQRANYVVNETFPHQNLQTNDNVSAQITYVPKAKVKVKAKIDNKLKPKIIKKTKGIKQAVKDKVLRKVYVPQVTTNHIHEVVK